MILILAVIVGGLAIVAAIQSPRQPDNPETALKACLQAQDFVLDRLKAPTTADFMNCYEVDVEKITTKESDGSWSAVGFVDAQNSFGAKIRSRYFVKLRYASGEWRAETVIPDMPDLSGLSGQ